MGRAHGNLDRAILGYNHSSAYVRDVLARARAYARANAAELTTPVGETTALSDCADDSLEVMTGPANLRESQRLASPRAFRTLPRWAMAGATASGAVDARLYDDVVWVLRRYHLRVTAAREAGHHTHGDGTAVDLIPADASTQARWDASAGRLAHDLGWTPACARSGTRPACRLAPAIQFIGYDGYPGHGSPRTCSGGCPAHLHVSWASPCYGTSNLSPPCQWVMSFAVLPAHYTAGMRPGPRTAGIGDSHPAALAMRASAGPLGEQSGRCTAKCNCVLGRFVRRCRRWGCCGRLSRDREVHASERCALPIGCAARDSVSATTS